VGPFGAAWRSPRNPPCYIEEPQPWGTMRASEFEFRQRFWLIGLVYWAGFACYWIDHNNAGVELLRLLYGRKSVPDTLGARHELQLIFGAGALLCALAAFLRTWGAAYLKSEVVHDMNLRTEALVADGPYRYVRNPLYLGSILLAVGIGLMASGLGWFVIVIGNILFNLRLIGREESALAATQGSGYGDYLAAVPRLVPALSPRLPSGGVTPRWRQAWQGEWWVWMFALAVALFAATLNRRASYLFVALAVVYYVVRIAQRRRYTRAA